jgi:short-subunit dehydrogenase
MKPRLKPVGDQVIVITGASSGIGRVTARLAAARGAKVVAAARGEDALAALAADLRAAGAEVETVIADVGNEEEVQEIARVAIASFGRIDAWVNNAGVSVFGKISEVPIDDARRLFETNFWGVVHGSRAALPHLARQGGALVNVGSVLSDRAVPLQGIYCASKHAVKGFTEALRMEVEEAGLPISVTLIKPGAIDTPNLAHARNYLDVEPARPSPVYAPETVAEAILHALEFPVRDLDVGAGAMALAAAGQVAPRLIDKLMEKVMVRAQRSDRPRKSERDALYVAGGDGRERGGESPVVFERRSTPASGCTPSPRRSPRSGRSSRARRSSCAAADAPLAAPRHCKAFPDSHALYIPEDIVEAAAP